MLGITQPPPGARFHGSLPRWGKPVHIAEYADGFKVCAYLEPADPTIGRDAGRRYCAWVWAPEKQKWVQSALPDQPRPLYRAENFEPHPDWPVYVFEREDMVDAFHALSGDDPVIATTCPGGSGAFVLGQWEALNGREVVLWPTHCPPCEQAMQELARRLDKAGAAVSFVSVPQTLDANWSVLQAIESAWDWNQVAEFVRGNRQQLERQVVPIEAARIRSSSNGASAPASAVQEPPKQKQPAVQVIAYRDAWKRIPGLSLAPNGTPYCNQANVSAVIEGLKGRYADVWYDEFYCRVMTDEQNPRRWVESDTLEFTHILQAELGFAGMRTPVVLDGVHRAANKRRRHEVRDWLLSLKWDEQWRLACALPIGWGTETTPYMTSVGRCFIMGAVARILHPGCQVDYVPVFEAPGGRGKTSSLRTLFGRWFDNPTSYVGEKDFLQNMNGKWCLELAELANIKGRTLESVKATITRVIDTYRASFGRAPGDYPRQCVFAGTIDQGSWNTDQAGGRRWWPVKCGKIDLGWIAEHREQLFAEAVHRVKDGMPWWDVPEHDARAQQAARQQSDPWEGKVAQYIKARLSVELSEVLESGLGMVQAKDWSDGAASRLKRLMVRLQWVEQPDHSWKPGKRALNPLGPAVASERIPDE